MKAVCKLTRTGIAVILARAKTRRVEAHILRVTHPEQYRKVNFRMGKKNFPTDVINQAQDVLMAWNQIDQDLAFGSLNRAALATDVTSAQEIEADISALESQLTARRNQRDDVYSAAWDKIKRVRAGVKANYGDDSSEYELIGGTRVSERKSPTRRVPA